MIFLGYLPANDAYVFAFGEDRATAQLLRMGDGSMFHPHRASAVSAAFDCGLQVLPDNSVVSLDEAEAAMADYWS